MLPGVRGLLCNSVELSKEEAVPLPEQTDAVGFQERLAGIRIAKSHNLPALNRGL